MKGRRTFASHHKLMRYAELWGLLLVIGLVFFVLSFSKTNVPNHFRTFTEDRHEIPGYAHQDKSRESPPSPVLLESTPHQNRSRESPPLWNPHTMTEVERQNLPNAHLFNLQRDYMHPSKGCDFSTFVMRFYPNKLAITCDSLSTLVYGRVLGEGFYRQVLEATTVEGQKVAVKNITAETYHEYGFEETIVDHTEEAAVMFALRNASNIVQIVGWCNATIITELLGGTTLEKLVLDPKINISVRQALRWSIDIMTGVMQLHEIPGGPIVHRDIDAGQLLFDAQHRVKLGDFNRMKYAGVNLRRGESHRKCDFNSGSWGGNQRSPEEYDVDTRENEKLDIYSACVVLWQLRSRVDLFDELEYERCATLQKANRLRLPVKDMLDYPEAMQDLILDGTTFNPKERPTARELVERITTIYQDYVAEHPDESEYEREDQL